MAPQIISPFDPAARERLRRMGLLTKEDQVNASVMDVAQCSNADLAEWHFMSPDGSLDVSYQTVQTQIPALKIKGGNTNELTLEGIPEMFNGVKVYCKFSNSAGSVNTASTSLSV